MPVKCHIWEDEYRRSFGKKGYPVKRLGKEKIPEDVRRLVGRLIDHGHQAYIVGGAIRDLLLGKTPKDWDVATNAEPQLVEAIFSQTVPSGKRFGTISVNTGERWVEVTTFRKDGPYRNGRRPEWVSFSSDIDDDLMRRDFTVNAIAYNPLNGEIVDPTGGVSDLRRRILRAIGDPSTRFREDALRMIRFYRFQSTLGFKGDRRTERAVEARWIVEVSSERIRDELSRILISERPTLGLMGLLRSGLLREIAPEIAAMNGVVQGTMHRYDVMGHSLAATEAIRPELALRWAALLHDVGKPSTRFVDGKGIHFYGHDQRGAELAEEILRRLAYPKGLICQVAHLIGHHMFFFGREMTDAAVRRLVARVGAENISSLLELRRADIVAANGRFDRAWEGFRRCRERIAALLEGENVFTRRDLAISGEDLRDALGWTTGPRYHLALDKALEWVLENPKRNNKEVLLEYVRSLSLDEEDQGQ